METGAPVVFGWRLFNLPCFQHHETRFISIDLSLCEACGGCVDACPRGVLGMVALFNHYHVHVDRASKCRGCYQCMETCPQIAIQPRAKRPDTGRRPRG